VDDRIREKLANLIRLAKRPGTPQEGEAARLAAVRLSLKYGIACEFTAGGSQHTSTRPTASAPPQSSAQGAPVSDDAIFYQWIKALSALGWNVWEAVDTKIGRQLKFRKTGYNSELRITQRARGGGKDFEAEHIKRPDPVNGEDLSYCIYMTISLKELLRHISYTAG